MGIGRRRVHGPFLSHFRNEATISEYTDIGNEGRRRWANIQQEHACRDVYLLDMVDTMHGGRHGEMLSLTQDRLPCTNIGPAACLTIEKAFQPVSCFGQWPSV